VVIEIALLAVLTLVAASVGTLSGFGTSTIMVPILLFFFPLPVTLLFAGIIHWFGDIWKMIFFRSGVRWRLLLLFGVTGIVASYIGASLIITIPEEILSRLLGGFLLLYVSWLWLNPKWHLPERNMTAVAGGVFSGFFAGIFGVGGAVRGAFLSAYNLPKEIYLFTSGAIALAVDSTRLIAYWGEDIRLTDTLLLALAISIPTSLLGAYIAKRIVNRISQEKFRLVIAIFLAVIACKLLIFP
jgi:uncharacterized membrane protein YfcA